MSDTLDEAIQSAIVLYKSKNRPFKLEFALNYLESSDGDTWTASIGGVAFVMLGEFEGDCSATGASAAEAVSALVGEIERSEWDGS